MTASLTTRIASPSRPRILSRALTLRFVTIVASSIGFFLPLSALPLFAESRVPGSAGVANGALLIACVVGELVSPWIIARIGVRGVLGLGLALLGLPMLLVLVPGGMPVLVASGVVRGIGFAFAVVAGGALTAALIPAQRRGEGLAIVGMVAGVPSFVALPAGVWVAQEWGFAVVAVIAAAVPVLSVVTLLWLPRAASADEGHGSLLAGLRSGAVMRPAVIFLVSAAATGVLVTYLPLAVTGAPAWLAPAALFLQPVAATAGRWIAGRVGDRVGTGRLIVPGIALSAGGLGLAALTGTSACVLAGAALLGLGFGVLQNSTLTAMYARSSRTEFAVVSAVWNAAYDGGMAIGAIAVGALGAATGFGPAFLVVAAAVAATLVIARLDSGARVTRSARRLPA